jgi:hypothetical protein
MDVTVYLPDDMAPLVKRAKKEERGLLSQLLRDALTTEMERRDAMSETLTDAKEIELELEDNDGNPYKGRFTGKEIDRDGSDAVYLTDDERVLIYDAELAVYWEVEDPESELEEWPAAARALGITPVVDI